jgi:hypothetical protein
MQRRQQVNHHRPEYRQGDGFDVKADIARNKAIKRSIYPCLCYNRDYPGRKDLRQEIPYV